MKKFLISCALFAMPMVILIVTFIVVDPFMTIKHYDNYYAVGSNKGCGVNRDYVSTMTYIQQYEKYHYDSFIFGNSRSIAYKVDDWSKHLDNNAVCFHFDEMGGSIEGLYYKLRFIDKHGEYIKNALFVVDPSLLNTLTRNSGALFVRAPALMDNSNYISFQLEHFRNWVNPRFLYNYVKFSILGIYTKDMATFIASGDNYPYYNLKNNEINQHITDSLIGIGTYYTEERMTVFHGVQNPSISSPVLTDSAKINRLKDMAKILKKHKTKFKIIISPLYNQVKINPDDYQLLRDIFGGENIYDFSGVNKWTTDYHNYYESSHYRPCVAREIMELVYQKSR